MSSKFKAPVFSKIVGVCSGDEAETRQLALRLIREHWDSREKDCWFADLVPDPDNIFDQDAIQVMVDVPVLGRTHAGFISNREGICDFCRKSFESAPKGACPNCKKAGTIRRDGLASQICRALREDPHLNFFCILTSITGGPDPDQDTSTKAKSFGCNLKIVSYVKKKQREEER